MSEKKMPAPNEYSWYKWFPAKALTSLRWASLTVTEEGVYRRMYDLASLAQPSIRRGYFYEHDVPANTNEVLKFLRIDPRTGHKCIKKFAKMGLMNQDENGAWGFPNFHKHQRKANLRPRPDGLGSAESGTISGQNRGSRARDADADTDTDADADLKEEETLTSSAETTPPKTRVSPPDFQGMMTAWNDMAANTPPLKKMRLMTEKRKRALRQRWCSKEWRENWQDALSMIPECSFLRGVGGRGWRADMDWFLRPDSVTKILEGAYEQGKIVDVEQEAMHAQVIAEEKARDERR